MRQSVVMLCCSAAGILGGGALIGLWALGMCLIFVSLVVGVYALSRDDGIPPQVHEVPGLPQILERLRAS